MKSDGSSSCALAFLLLVNSVAMGQTNLFPTARGESIICLGGASVFSRVEVSHNSHDRLVKEIHADEFRTLLIQLVKLPENTKLKYALGELDLVQVSTLGLTKEKAQSVADMLDAYVRSRASGHTAKYALDSLKQRLSESRAETNGFLATLFETFPDIPRQWVKEDPSPSPILSANNAIPPHRFVVIDGEIAWSYSVPVGTGQASGFKVDAKEFDPKLKPKFDAARKEAEENLAKRGVKKGFGYVHQLQAEEDLILLQKYKITRRSFQELNPGIIID